nr:phage tail spike protein [Streptococcus suis]
MIYLFDKDEKLIKIVRKSAVKTALQKYALTTERYVSDRLTVELKGLNADELEQVEYMAIQTLEDAHTFHYFYVAQKSSDELTTLIGVQSGIEELRKSPVYDKRPQNTFARDVITDLLAGTNWQARFVGETTPHSTNFYYTSVFDALKKVCEVWDLEMQFFVEMNGNRIGGRYIDFKQRIGQAVGKRVVYGHNALQILQEVERTNIFTALVGRGKGEETGAGYGRKITFEDVTWSTDQGKPVNKPAGQKYLELPLMTQQYGIKNADGSMRPKIGFVDFSEEENPEVLIERTYRALVDSARPQLTLKTSSVYLKGVKIGDTIRVVRHDKKLDYDTRIFEITFNRLNNQSSDIKLGDRIGESNEAKVQTIADKAVEQFITNEFSTFVQNLPNHLPSADGFNNNWYGAEDPTVKYPGKVLINDIWYKPDPEHEGHKIMLRWTGEVWEEILRTYDSEALRDRIAEEITQVNQSMQAQSEEHDRQVADILAKTQSVESLANQAKTDAAGAIAQALQSKDEAVADARAQVATVSQALNTAKTELQAAIANNYVAKSTYDENVRGTTLKLNEIKTTADTAKQNLATYQNTVDRKLTELTTSTQTLDGKINTASAKVDTVAGQIRTEISEVEGKIPTEIGGRNYFSRSLSNYNTDGTYAYRRLPKDTITISVSDNDVNQNTDWCYIGVSKNGYNASAGYYWIVRQGQLVTDKITINGFSCVSIYPKTQDTIDKLFNRYKIKVETGTVATDWSPAPEDYDDELSSVKTTITQTASGVEQLSTSLTTTDSKVTTAEAKIRQLISDVSSKVSQTDYNTLTGRVDSAETAITQNATEISKRLTSTQVESAITSKGYQTKSDVDSNITGRGYATTTVLENKVRETADSFSRSITETRALIPSVEGLATVTALHAVNDTVDSHTRTIGAVGTAGSILDNVSKVTQTAAGLVQEVSGANGLKTQVSQLAGSYAIQNLTNSGTVLNQLNLNKDGSVKIDGKLVQITGKTYIQDGVITSAKIGKGQIGTAHIGEIDAGIAKIINLDVSNIKGLDAEFIKAKIENAFIEWMKGKTITAQNDAMQMDLNNANISFNTNATINFNSANNALVRRRGTHTAFLHFNDVASSSDANAGGVYAGLGVTSSGDGINSQSSGRFSGIRIFRSAIGYNHGATVDQVELYGDTIYLKDGFDGSRGYVFKTTKTVNQTIDMNLYINAIKAIAHCLNHLRSNNWDWKLPNLRNAISGLMDSYINKTDFYNKLQV